MPVTIDGTTGITSPAIDVTTPVTTTDGGTGLSSFTANGAMYATSTSALTTGTLPVASGGTGATSLTANNVLLGNGTAAVQLVAPGSSGNVLTSNGTTWTSAAAGGGQLRTQLFTSPGTWTNPGTVTQVRVTVIGGGGGSSPGGPAGGTGGVAVSYSPVSGPISVTVGAGGAAGSGGGSSSFGALVSATGGSAATNPLPFGTPGTGTVTTGTAIVTSNILSISAMGGEPTYPSTLCSLIPDAWGRIYFSPPSASATTYTQNGIMAGAGGLSVAGPQARGANGGLVIVEFVG